MPQNQIALFGALSRDFGFVSAENAKHKAEVDAAATTARQQIATARELLARLDAILKSSR